MPKIGVWVLILVEVFTPKAYDSARPEKCQQFVNIIIDNRVGQAYKITLGYSGNFLNYFALPFRCLFAPGHGARV